MDFSTPPNIDKDSIAAWHDAQADKHTANAKAETARATKHREMARMLRGRNAAPAPGKAIVNGVMQEMPARVVTVEQLSKYLVSHGGRSVHVAKHFGVEPQAIEKLVADSNGEIWVAPRGWLKTKQETSAT